MARTITQKTWNQHWPGLRADNKPAIPIGKGSVTTSTIGQVPSMEMAITMMKMMDLGISRVFTKTQPTQARLPIWMNQLVLLVSVQDQARTSLQLRSTRLSIGGHAMMMTIRNGYAIRQACICDDVQPDANEIFQLLLWLLKLQKCVGMYPYP